MVKRRTEQEEPPFDKAKARLKQFEDARRPQEPEDESSEKLGKGKRKKKVKDKKGGTSNEKPNR